MSGTYWNYGFMEYGYFSVKDPDSGSGSAAASRNRQRNDDIEFRVDYREGGAVLMQRLSPATAKRETVIRTLGPGPEWEPLYELKPSAATPGDWDLAVMHARIRDERTRDFILTRLELRAPIPSFFRRLDDSRAMDYFDLVAQDPVLREVEKNRTRPMPPSAENAKRRLDLALAMTRDHPDDPGYGIFELDACTGLRDAVRLRAAVEHWRPKFAAAPPSLALGFRRAEESARALELSAAGRNFSAYLFDVLGGMDLGRSRFDTVSRIKRTDEIWKYDDFAQIEPPLGGVPIPNFLALQTDIKVNNVYSVFLLMRGRPEAALDLSLASFRTGQLMLQSGSIEGLIGVAVRAIAVESLGDCFLSGMDSPDELAATWKRLEALNAREQPFSLDHAVRLERWGVLSADQRTTSTYWDYSEIEPRAKVVDARFQILRMAAAARYCQLSTGALPASVADFGPLLPALPLDPFTSAPLHFIASPGVCTVYSVGPDKTDNRASIVYDPSNGTWSSGDLFTAVPRERQFPFPKEGVRARTREELMAQFPNGLPRDPFDGNPLVASPTEPVYVFSFGPDTDGRMRGGPAANFRDKPEGPYDPTNGITSDGDLILLIPGG